MNGLLSLMNGLLALLLIVLAIALAVWAGAKITNRRNAATRAPARFDLSKIIVERTLGKPLDTMPPVHMTINQAAQALWPLNDRFRPRLEQIQALPYDKAQEAAADAAVERLVLDDSDWSGEQLGVWRVLWERHSQVLTLLGLKATEAGSWDAPFIPVPEPASASLRNKLAIAFLLHSTPLPFPIAERAGMAQPSPAPGVPLQNTSGTATTNTSIASISASARAWLSGEEAAALVAPAQRFTDLPDGNRSIQELAAEHQGWERTVAGQNEGATFLGPTPAEQHVRLLGLLATKLREDDTEEAIACLRRQRELASAIGEDSGQAVEWWLRLPKYLQTAGRTDEALAEIESLIDHAAANARNIFAHQPPYVVEMFEKQSCARFCSGAELICKRADRPEQQRQYEHRRHTYEARADKLRAIKEADDAARAKDHERAKEAGGQALLDLLAARAKATEENRRRNQSAAEVFQPLQARVQERIEDVPDFFQAARHSPFDPLTYLREGDIDGARQVLQRLAYLVHQDRETHPEQAAEFTRLMCMFVEIDPLFKAGVQAVLPVIANSPGVRQTELYPFMNLDVEMCRYVLYFAHETGRIRRVKKGNTYQVYLPQAEDAAP